MLPEGPEVLSQIGSR